MGLFVKQRSPTETEVAELAEQLSKAQDQNDFFLITIRALLYFIKAFSLDLVEIGADTFKRRIDALSEQFTSESKLKTLQNAFDDSKHLIIGYINKEKDYLQDRENEFKNIIALLTTGIQNLTESNATFQVRMFERSARLEDITYLNDIRQIKEELKQEVETIERCLQEKQSQDATQVEALRREVESLRVDFQKAKQASMTDSLTGVFNRQSFDAHLTRLIDHNTITPTPFSLLMLDIDNFKQINDTYGHPVGDRVLLALVQLCQGLIRKDDFMARYGGEEFAIILPAASLRHALKKARAICKTVVGARYTLDSKHSNAIVSFTVSIGVSTFQPGDTAASLIERADKALYEAKRQGKNRAMTEKWVE